MRNVLLLFAALLVVAGCEKTEKLDLKKRTDGVLFPSDSARITVAKVPDSITVQDGDVAKGVEWVRPRDPVVGVRVKEPGLLVPRYRPYYIDTSSLPTRTLPDFTDASVGIMISNMGQQNPSQITTCIIDPLGAMIAQIQAGAISAPLYWPDPNIPAQSCSESSPELWRTTDAQNCWIGRTEAAVLAGFLDAIKMYQLELNRRGYWFPCRIVGLDYGASLCLPVTGLQVQRIMSGTRIVEFRIILKH